MPSFIQGERVKVAWTCSNRHFQAHAEVIKVNRESYTVTLLEALEGYPIGNKIRVPKFGPVGNRLNKLEA